MFKITPGLNQLLASPRRPQTDPEYSFIRAREPNIRRALALGSDSLEGLIQEQSAIAGDLPYVEMTTERKTAISKGYYDEQPEVLRLLARAQRLSVGQPPATGTTAAPGPTGAPGPANGLLVVPPERLEGWAPLMDLYSRITEEAEGGANLAMDLNLELDAFGWYTVRTVMTPLVQTLEDPAVSDADKEALRDGFKDFLAYKDLVLQAQADHKGQLAQVDAETQAQIEAAHQDEVLMQVQYAVEHGQPVDQATLEQAAQWWQERQAQAAGGAQQTTAAQPAAAGTDARRSKR